jgi:hypothetical protein
MSIYGKQLYFAMTAAAVTAAGAAAVKAVPTSEESLQD